MTKFDNKLVKPISQQRKTYVMNIVIEGPDGSGKSTLAQRIVQHVPLTLQLGQGPEQYPGEIIERVWRYLKMDNKLFDRHPCISQPIYSRFRENATDIPQELIDLFYAQKPLLIYCYGFAGPHEVKDYEAKEHVAMVEQFDRDIREIYKEWSSNHANITYSVKTGNLDFVIEACKEFCK